MTREEFNKILSEERDKEMTQLCKKLGNVNNASKDELVSEIMACSIGSSVTSFYLRSKKLVYLSTKIDVRCDLLG